MNTRNLFGMLVFLGMGIFVFAQEKPAPSPSSISIVKTAVGTVAAAHNDLDGYVAILADPKTWTSLLKDADLGPFLKLKAPRSDRSAVVLIANPEKVMTFCVYFEGDVAVGWVALPPSARGKIEAAEVASAYKPLKKDAIKTQAPDFQISDETISSNGVPVSTYNIHRAGKSAKK